MHDAAVEGIMSLPYARRPRLSLGSKGAAVMYMQSLLNSNLGFRIPMKCRISEDGCFRQDTYDAVSLFQQRNGLRITGQVDSTTWKRLDETPCLHDNFKLNPNLIRPIFFYRGTDLSEPQMALADIAIAYIGATEAKGNHMGTDPRMKEIFESDDLMIGGATDGYYWCSSFVSLCIQKLIKQYPMYYWNVVPPREPSVFNFLNSWAVNHNCLIYSPSSSIIQPLAGDIVVFRKSHIGIVEYVQPGAIHTIEGNTDVNGSRDGIAVARKKRVMGNIQKFIRLPVSRAF